MTVTEAWALLGLEPTDDARAAKRAYSALLKQIDVDADPQGFIRLREALELALDYGANIPEWESGDYDDPADWAIDDQVVIGDSTVDTPFPADQSDQAGEPWQHSPTPAATGALDEATQNLSRLLFGQVQTTAADIEAAGLAVLAEVDKATVDEAAATERWLLGALVDSIPRSDPLIGPAIDHFGWDNAVRPRDYGFGYDLDTLRERRNDRAKLSRILSTLPDRAGPFDEQIDLVGDRRAISELRQTGRTRVTPFELSLAWDVQRFLQGTLIAHPTMERDLDPGQLAFWRAHFEGRHLPVHFWLIVFVVPPILAFFTMLGFGSGGLTPPLSFFPMLAAALVLTLAAIFAFVELSARARIRERAIYDHGYQSRRAERWLLLGLLLSPLAALTPFGLLTGVGWSAVALATAIGMFMTTRTPVGDDGYSSLGTRAVSGITLIASGTVCFALMAIANPPAHLLGPLFALCYISYRGHETAAFSMSGISVGKTRALLGLCSLLAVAAIGPLLLYAPGLPPPALLMLVPVAAAAQHLATAHLFLATGRLEWAMRTLGIIFYFTAGRTLFGDRAATLVASILLYVLLYSFARGAIAFWRDATGGNEPPANF